MGRIDRSERGVLITEESARRIARAIQRLEQGGRAVDGRKIRTAFDEGNELKLGKISEDWDKGNTAEVVEINPDGTDISPSPTFEAVNYFASVTVGSGTKKVMCANLGGKWILIAAECD